jgi:hypothetical protein
MYDTLLVLGLRSTRGSRIVTNKRGENEMNPRDEPIRTVLIVKSTCRKDRDIPELVLYAESIPRTPRTLFITRSHCACMQGIHWSSNLDRDIFAEILTKWTHANSKLAVGSQFLPSQV